MSGPATQALTRALDELRHDVRYPYGLFVAEALRSFGAPVAEEKIAAKLRPRVDAAVEAYRAAVLEEDPFADILGLVYQEENSRGQRDMNGQFFTPWALCRMMARMNVVDDWTPGPAPDGGLTRVNDPAYGSGATLLAVCAELVDRFQAPGVLQLWEIWANDIDLTCARTCALQLLANQALRGWTIGRVVIQRGDTLRMEGFSTVLHTSNGPDPEAICRVWAEWEPVVKMLGVIRSTSALVEEALPTAEEPAQEVGELGQLALFAEEEAA